VLRSGKGGWFEGGYIDWRMRGLCIVVAGNSNDSESALGKSAGSEEAGRSMGCILLWG